MYVICIQNGCACSVVLQCTRLQHVAAGAQGHMCGPHQATQRHTLITAGPLLDTKKWECIELLQCEHNPLS